MDEAETAPHTTAAAKKLAVLERCRAFNMKFRPFVSMSNFKRKQNVIGQAQAPAKSIRFAKILKLKLAEFAENLALIKKQHGIDLELTIFPNGIAVLNIEKRGVFVKEPVIVITPEGFANPGIGPISSEPRHLMKRNLMVVHFIIVFTINMKCQNTAFRPKRNIAT